jgi:hypothetical protein
MDDLKVKYQQALESVGVPVSLASQAAEIVAKDDPAKPDLGRTPEELHVVQSAYTWMVAKLQSQ